MPPNCPAPGAYWSKSVSARWVCTVSPAFPGVASGATTGIGVFVLFLTPFSGGDAKPLVPGCYQCVISLAIFGVTRHQLGNAVWEIVAVVLPRVAGLAIGGHQIPEIGACRSSRVSAGSKTTHDTPSTPDKGLLGHRRQRHAATPEAGRGWPDLSPAGSSAPRGQSRRRGRGFLAGPHR